VLGSDGPFRLQRAIQQCDGKEVAFKQAYLPESNSSKALQYEYELLRGIKHPNILQVVGFFACGPHGTLITELFEGRTLRHALEQLPEQRLTERVAKRLFTLLLGAVEHIHVHQICHRQINPTAIKVSTEWTSLKLSSFEGACRLQADEQIVVSRNCLRTFSAENETKMQALYSADIRKTGVCLCYMLSGDLQASDAPVDLTSAPWCKLSKHCQEVLIRATDMQATAAELRNMLWLVTPKSSMTADLGCLDQKCQQVRLRKSSSSSSLPKLQGSFAHAQSFQRSSSATTVEVRNGRPKLRDSCRLPRALRFRICNNEC